MTERMDAISAYSIDNGKHRNQSKIISYTSYNLYHRYSFRKLQQYRVAQKSKLSVIIK